MVSGRLKPLVGNNREEELCEKSRSRTGVVRCRIMWHAVIWQWWWCGMGVSGGNRGEDGCQWQQGRPDDGCQWQQGRPDNGCQWQQGRPDNGCQWQQGRPDLWKKNTNILVVMRCMPGCSLACGCFSHAHNSIMSKGTYFCCCPFSAQVWAVLARCWQQDVWWYQCGVDRLGRVCRLHH